MPETGKQEPDTGRICHSHKLPPKKQGRQFLPISEAKWEGTSMVDETRGLCKPATS